MTLAGSDDVLTYIARLIPICQKLYNILVFKRDSGRVVRIASSTPIGSPLVYLDESLQDNKDHQSVRVDEDNIVFYSLLNQVSYYLHQCQNLF